MKRSFLFPVLHFSSWVIFTVGVGVLELARQGLGRVVAEILQLFVHDGPAQP